MTVASLWDKGVVAALACLGLLIVAGVARLPGPAETCMVLGMAVAAIRAVRLPSRPRPDSGCATRPVAGARGPGLASALTPALLIVGLAGAIDAVPAGRIGSAASVVVRILGFTLVSAVICGAAAWGLATGHAARHAGRAPGMVASACAASAALAFIGWAGTARTGVVVIAASCEELVFRWILPARLQLGFGKVGARGARCWGMLVAQLAFAGCHVILRPDAALADATYEVLRLVCAGIFFCVLSEVGGIPLSALAHAVVNLTLVSGAPGLDVRLPAGLIALCLPAALALWLEVEAREAHGEAAAGQRTEVRGRDIVAACAPAPRPPLSPHRAPSQQGIR